MKKQQAMIEGRKQAPADLGAVLVLGLGKTGEAVCLYCLDQTPRVSSLTVYAGKGSDAARAAAAPLEAAGATIIFDEEDISGNFDLCIASPGISQFSHFYESASEHAKELISEVEFAWRESAADSRWVAITGTNGKTTTTALTAHLLQAAGKRALAVGNIGDTCIDAVKSEAPDYYVAEVSSYQLASTEDFAPDVAVLLNITPDHIKWHKSLEAYAQAKKRVYANLAAVDGVAIMDAVDDVVREYVKELKAIPGEERGFTYIPLGCAAGIDHSMQEACGSENAAWSNNDTLCVSYLDNDVMLVAAGELQIPGEHNISNALAAAASALVLGCDVKAVREGLRSFAPLEHRIEPAGSVNGVECYNDSKATNVDATLNALAAFGDKKPIVLLGGDDKGTSLDVLVAEATKHTKAVVCYGEGGPRFFAAFEGTDLAHYEAPHMEQAFDKALSIAQPGDIIVLSPACASFDEFSCFEERGETFKKLVRARAGGKNG